MTKAHVEKRKSFPLGHFVLSCLRMDNKADCEPRPWLLPPPPIPPICPPPSLPEEPPDEPRPRTVVTG